MAPNREREIFEAGIELPTEEQVKFVCEACAGDPELERRIHRLIAAHRRASEAERSDRTAPFGPVFEDPTHIGPYRIHERLGEGGMGVVYVAVQTRPVRRRVAIKIIKLGMDTKEVIARFDSERQALALMNHPSIARILDAGATQQGRPYFVMEYVPGSSIVDYCNRMQLQTDERLRLFIRVCQAVQHAHDKGVIHRDLKPPNILVAVEDGHAVPKVIDFGIAKATNQRLSDLTVHTQVGRAIGTPEYMSPEQAGTTALDIDGRTDVYSLGVVLYELLTGAVPFNFSLSDDAFLEIQHVIREVEPPPPSVRLGTPDHETLRAAQNRSMTPEALARELRGELDWITMKALAKDRIRRYDSPAAFADDINRFLQHEPVVASRPGRWYRARKFARRYRTSLMTVATIGVLTLALAGSLMVRVPELGVEEPSVAVLPLVALGLSDEDRLLADGLHESIITHLSKVGAVRVVSRSSVLPYAGDSIPVADIGRDLGVATVVEGSLQRVGDQLRVTVRVVRASDGVQLWADEYDRPYRVEEVFGIQSAVAEEIAASLGASLLPQERERIRVEPTTSLTALEEYFRGIAFTANQYEVGEAENAVAAFERAVSLDPNFGIAYAQLAIARIWLAWQFFPRPGEGAAAEAALERAVALAPDAVETKLAQGFVRYRADRDYDAAMRHFREAEELAPNSYDVHRAIGFIHRRLGQWNEALERFERANALSPRDATLLYTLAHTLHLMRRFEESEEWFTQLATVSSRVGPQGPMLGRFELWTSLADTAAARTMVRAIPRAFDETRRSLLATLDFYGRHFQEAAAAHVRLHVFPFSRDMDRHMSVAMLYEVMGDSERQRVMADSVRLDAEAALERLAVHSPNELAQAYGRLGLAHALLGNRDAALEAGELGIRALPLSADAYTGRWAVQRMALIHLLLGHVDEAIDILEQLMSIPSEVTPQMLRLDPRWDRLREHPRFVVLVRSDR